MSTVQARQRVDEASAVPEPRRPVVNVVRRVVARGVLGLCVLLLAVFILGPLVWLSLRAFAASWSYPSLLPESWTLSWWRQVLADQTLGSSIRLSFTFAPVVTALPPDCEGRP